MGVKVGMSLHLGVKKTQDLVVPLIAINSMGNLFNSLITCCGGPLPKTRSGSSFPLAIMAAVTWYP